DVKTGAEVRRFRADKRGIRAVALTRDGKIFASAGSGDQTIRLWEPATGRQIASCKDVAAGFPHILAVSADGKVLASVHNNSYLCLWEVPTGKQLHRLGGERIGMASVAFAPDGKTVATGGYEGHLRLWDVATGRVLESRLHRPALDQMAFSSDGRTLATGNQHRKEISLWEVKTGKLRQQLQGHQGHITALAFAPDGRRLASGSADATVLIWDVPGRPPREPQAGAQPTLAELDGRWRDLADEDAARAYRALCALAATPRPAVALVRKHVHP